MAPTPLEIEAAALAAALSPQSATVDGNSATARPAADFVLLANYAAGLAAAAQGRPSIRQFKLVPPGTVGPSSQQGP